MGCIRIPPVFSQCIPSPRFLGAFNHNFLYPELSNIVRIGKWRGARGEEKRLYDMVNPFPSRILCWINRPPGAEAADGTGGVAPPPPRQKRSGGKFGGCPPPNKTNPKPPVSMDKNSTGLWVFFNACWPGLGNTKRATSPQHPPPRCTPTITAAKTFGFPPQKMVVNYLRAGGGGCVPPRSGGLRGSWRRRMTPKRGGGTHTTPPPPRAGKIGEGREGSPLIGAGGGGVPGSPPGLSGILRWRGMKEVGWGGGGWGIPE